MSVIIILLIVSISVAGLFLLAFIWSVKTGQFHDEISPAVKILFDDRPSVTNEPITTELPESKKDTYKPS